MALLSTLSLYRRRVPKITSNRFVLYLVIILLAAFIFSRDPVRVLMGQTPYKKSSYDWSRHRYKYPLRDSQMAHLPTGEPLALPRVQFDFAGSSNKFKKGQPERAREVREAMKRTWHAYARFAMGRDELLPISLKGRDTFSGWGATAVDSLDTLYIMGLTKEFAQGLRHVKKIDWNRHVGDRANTFETIIRYLGGLLGAYDLSGEGALLHKAVELGNMMYGVFDNEKHMPGWDFDHNWIKTGRLDVLPKQSSAALGSMSLEFTRLAQITGNHRFYDAIDRITRNFARTQYGTLLPGMWPTFINVADDFKVTGSVFSFAGDEDSLYEYLLKEYMLLGGLEPLYENMYRKAMDTAVEHLLYRPRTPDKLDILFLGRANVDEDLGSVTHTPEMQHLTCFAGGMFALGGRVFNNAEHVRMGEALARGCAWAYSVFPLGLAPETGKLMKCETLEPCEWDEKKWEQARGPSGNKLPRGWVGVTGKAYILRPEAIESIFVLYRITGKEDLLDVAWAMFKAVREAAWTENSFAEVKDVMATDKAEHFDSMQSFFPAETLKYFYLMFSDPDYISLDDYVFSTEAHPFIRPARKKPSLWGT